MGHDSRLTRRAQVVGSRQARIQLLVADVQGQGLAGVQTAAVVLGRSFIGTALAISLYWLIAVVLIGGYFIYSATVEERNMSRLFRDTYPRYRESTKMLIPYLL
jgi:protein-S-isoprenylcysteine O-methyltransferase Ste14